MALAKKDTSHKNKSQTPQKNDEVLKEPSAIKGSKKTKTKTKQSEPVLEKTNTKKKSVSKYDKLGQTKATPEETDSLRRFYTSLLKQNPKSRMALLWCLERGLLSSKKAQEALLMIEMEKKLKI